MNGTIAWWQSRAVWGGIIAAAAGLASIAGLSLSDADQTQVADAVTGLAAAVGGALAVYGRIQAEHKIVTPEPKP